MKNFKFTPKVALILVLVLITIAGIVLYLKTGPGSKSTTGNADTKGFLSFFGDRKVKPVDETTIPGVKPTNTGGLTSGNTAGNTGEINGVDTAGNTGGINGTNTAGNTGNTGGSLALQPIGSSAAGNIGGTGGVNGNLTNGGGTAGDTGGVDGGSGSLDNGGGVGGNISGFGTTGGAPNGEIRQIDCTPPQLPYSADEIAELKSLTQQFYRIAANLHTDADIENERNTRKSYFDLYNQTIDFTKQCYAELKETGPNKKYAGKSTESSARWHPYLTDAVVARIAKYDPRILLITSSAKTRLENEIASLKSKVFSLDTQQTYLRVLDSNGKSNDAQKAKIKLLQDDIDTSNFQIKDKQEQIKNLGTKDNITSKEIAGAFFTEDSYKLANLKEFQIKVARQNNNARIDKIWGYTKEIIDNSGHGSNKVDNLWTPSHELFQINPLKALVLDKRNESLDTAERIQPGNYPASWMNRFRMLEEGLRIW